MLANHHNSQWPLDLLKGNLKMYDQESQLLVRQLHIIVFSKIPQGQPDDIK